jgi:hypothetical protein
MAFRNGAKADRMGLDVMGRGGAGFFSDIDEQMK